jgi:uncharacterized protein (TIGR03435 family)
MGMRMTLPPGRIVLEKVTLRHTIKLAYNLQDWQLSGGPKWIDADPFDIEGKAAESTVFEQRKLMLQTLLADRFQLQLRRETRETPGYAIVIAKGGPKLPKPQYPDGPVGESSGPTLASGRNADMAQFAKTMSSALGRPVVDETALKDKFDFKLNWTVREDEPGASVFALVQEQLGLRLEARRIPAEFFVIERAEKPAAN